MPHQNDPNLPSYHRDELLEILPTLAMAEDITNDLRHSKSTYLHQEEKEPRDAYKKRLERAVFENRTTPAIKRLSGLVSKLNIESVPSSFEDSLNNIDLQGSSLQSFLAEADFLSLRDGFCCVLVDFPVVTESPANLLEQSQSPSRPYLTLLERKNIINWKLTVSGSGSVSFEFVVIKELVDIPNGIYGSQKQIYYRVLIPGVFQVWQIVERQDGELVAELVEEGMTTLDFIPIVYYPSYPSQLMDAQPPLAPLFDLNIKLFRKESEFDEVMRKCNLPVPVRKGVRADDEGRRPGLAIGPNSFIDLPEEGDFYFAEPTGNAIPSTEQKIASIKDDMDAISMAFTDSSVGQRTATEASISQASQLASLKTLAMEKEAALSLIGRYWNEYTGEAEELVITINTEVLVAKIDPQESQFLESLASQGFIDIRTLLLELQKGKVLSESVDIEEIVAMTERVQDDVLEVDDELQEDEDENEDVLD